jgi:hypothetical protein
VPARTILGMFVMVAEILAEIATMPGLTCSSIGGTP